MGSRCIHRDPRRWLKALPVDRRAPSRVYNLGRVAGTLRDSASSPGPLTRAPDAPASGAQDPEGGAGGAPRPRRPLAGVFKWATYGVTPPTAPAPYFGGRGEGCHTPPPVPRRPPPHADRGEEGGKSVPFPGGYSRSPGEYQLMRMRFQTTAGVEKPPPYKGPPPPLRKREREGRRIKGKHRPGGTQGPPGPNNTNY